MPYRVSIIVVVDLLIGCLLFLLVLERGFSLLCSFLYGPRDSFGWRVLQYHHSPVRNVYKLKVVIDSIVVLGCWFGFCSRSKLLFEGKCGVRRETIFLYLLFHLPLLTQRGPSVEMVLFAKSGLGG